MLYGINVYSDSLYRSTDHGKAWITCSFLGNGHRYTSYATDPAGNIFAGGNYAQSDLWESNDSGVSWFSALSVPSVSWIHADPNGQMLVGASTGLFMSNGVAD